MTGPPLRSTSLAVFAMALVILSAVLILAASIFTMMRETEEAFSQNMVHDVRVHLLAERGVSFAVERLRAWAASDAIDGPHAPWSAVQYRDVNGNSQFDAGIDEVEQYRRAEPARRLRHPSFAPPTPFSLQNDPIRIPDENADGHPETIGYSIRFPSPEESRTDLVALKVLDCASMIYVNGPADEPGGWGLAPNLVRLLNRLGDTPEVQIKDLGLMLDAWRRRERQAFETRRDIERALRHAGVSPRRIEAVRDLLTCQAWVDERTLNPGALSGGGEAGAEPAPTQKLRWTGAGTLGRRWGLPAAVLRHVWAACGADYLLGEQAGQPAVPAVAVEGVAAPPPRYGSASLLQPRAPVNVNTAPIEVLTAVLAALEASGLDRSARGAEALTASPGRLGRSPETTIDARTARTVAEHLVARRMERPFRSWEELDAFVLGLPEEDVSSARKRVILAGVNPNSRLSSFNPDRATGLRHGDVDKAALGEWRAGAWDASANRPFCGWGTELCFSSMGFYQVESVARLLGPPRDGVSEVLAEIELECVVQVYDVVRLTTQKDFLRALAATSVLPGGAGGAVIGPESLPDLRATRWSGPEGLAARCLELPESPSSGRGVCNHALCWDGWASLRPLDPPADPTNLLRADFEAGLEARGADRILPVLGTADAHRSLIDPYDPAELLPDGVLCHETRRSGFSSSARHYGHTPASLDEHVAWEAGGAFPEIGTLEMWVKPTWDGAELYDAASPDPGGAAEAEDTRTFFSFGRGDDAQGEDAIGGGRLVVFARRGMLAAAVGADAPTDGKEAAGGAAFLFSTPDRPWCDTLRAAATPIRHWRAGEWHHVRVSWTATELRLEADGMRALGPPLPLRARPFAGGIPPGWRWFVGTNRFRHGLCNGFPLTADATLDGLALRAGAPADLPPPDRYPGGPEPQGLYLWVLPGRDFPASDSARLGTLSWSGRTPASGGGIRVSAGPEQQDFSGWAPPAGPFAASGWTRLDVPIGRDVPCAVICALFPCRPDSTGIVRESPILEDLTVTVIGAPHFASWWVKEP